MIPQSVVNYLSQEGDQILRENTAAVLEALRKIGIEPETELGEFYIRYRGGFLSPLPRPELLDLLGPAIPAIPDQTEYVLERYELPEAFIALTSDESEGMYLYNKEDRSVYDFDVGNSQELVDGMIEARWRTFNEFLTWFFNV